jgi:hypothetical protein
MMAAIQRQANNPNIYPWQYSGKSFSRYSFPELQERIKRSPCPPQLEAAIERHQVLKTAIWSDALIA